MIQEEDQNKLKLMEVIIIFAMTASSSFFNFQAKDVYATKRLYFSADIKFTESNMEIQLRQSRDISASRIYHGWTIGERIFIILSIFQMERTIS